MRFKIRARPSPSRTKERTNAGRLSNMFQQSASVLPNWLSRAWLIVAPVGIAFAGLIAWQQVYWRWFGGPDPRLLAVKLVHLHPFLFMLSMLGGMFGLLTIIWLLPGLFYLCTRWKSSSVMDKCMVTLALLATIVLVVPT